MKRLLLILIAGWLSWLPAVVCAARVDAVEVDLVADRDAAVPGSVLQVGLRIRHDPQWHTYWRYPGDSGLATEFELGLPSGWTGGGILWPAPQRINIGPLSNYGFNGEVVLPVNVSVPAGTAVGAARVSARARWLMCREVCIPGEADLVLEIPVRLQAVPSPHRALFDAAREAAPRATIPVRTTVRQGVVSMLFERSDARAAEFFPYRAGMVRAAAPQKLYRIGEGAWRLQTEPADGADPERWFDGLAGLLVVDGEAYEVEARRAQQTSDGGTLVATALGVASERSAAQGGLLSKLVSGDSPSAGPDDASGESFAALLLASVSGVLGGLLLNLMPCVFPVIGLKVLGFADHARGDRRAARRGALAFGAGVLLSFWALAAVLLALRAAGQAVGWGFQLQSPPFVAAMALLFVAMGLNFAGVFEIGTAFTRLGGVDPLHTGRGGVAGAFGSGMLAVLVATPCSAPFMGSALGYTLGRPAIEVMLVFAAIAVGMALPYVLLGLFPQALRWLPRPGRWMESFRQFLAFPMFATVAWLAWVLGQQAGIDAVLSLALGAVMVAFAGWLHGRFVQSPAAVHRPVAAVLALGALVSGLWIAFPGPSSVADPAATPAPGAAGPRNAAGWEPWSEERVARAVAGGQAVFVDFTAAWCVSCQVNKKLVLDRAPVATEMERRDVLRLRADWTNRDPAITVALARHGRNGVPLYLLYLPGEASPRRLPEILTPGIVLGELAALR